MTTYCTRPHDRGLTCALEDLVLERRLSNDVGDTYVKRELVYRCKTCGGFYKHLYSERLETRNFDAEGGWFTSEDVYLKVGDVLTSTTRFPLNEARLYGYRDVEDSS